MKKIFLTLFFAAGIFVLWSHGEMVWSNRRFLDEPRVHKIEKGEYLSRLAQQYYGDPQRWRELALINRAPNPNHVEVGEEILVPAANVVAKIGRAQTLTKVNALVNDQEKLAREPSRPITETTSTPLPTPSGEITPDNGTAQPVAPVEETPAPIVIAPVANETSFPWLWVGLGAVVFALAGFIIYRWRQNAKPKVNFTVKPKENSFDDFLNRRHYGESGPFKAPAAEQKKEDSEETKDKTAGSGDFRNRQKYGESITATN
jgi:hypothetical protein